MRLYPVFKLKAVLTCALLSTVFFVSGQSYTSYFTGNSADFVALPHGGICLMGGASENDNAMRWFLEKANGGDVLVLRASGSDGYNDYLYQELGVIVNSVETIVFHNASASNDTDIHEKINKAEAIWIAGGDQWKYVSYWRNSPIADLINRSIKERNIVIGGTSAGMAILGEFYFSAQNGTVTSSAALANPYASAVTPDTTGFLKHEYLKYTITDTHYDNPNRKGRHVVFMARLAKDFGLNQVRGIACDEYTAVCIDLNGRAKVFGNYPQYDDFAWFLQINCESADPGPEICQANTPLHWLNNSQALKVYKVAGTSGGSKFFELDTWKTGQGGTWENWFVNNGQFYFTNGLALSCIPLDVSMIENRNIPLLIIPNPVNNDIITVISNEYPIERIMVFDLQGKMVLIKKADSKKNLIELHLSQLAVGNYIFQIHTLAGKASRKISIIRN